MHEYLNYRGMIIRVRSKNGISRLTVDNECSTLELAKKISEKLSIDPEKSGFTLSLQKTYSDDKSLNNSQLIPLVIDSSHFIFKDYNLKHGDMILLNFTIDGTEEQLKDSNLFFDDWLISQSGKINRERDTKLCKHVENGMCEYCSPVDAYDKKWLKENKIKHMSFYALVKSITASKGASSFSVNADINLKLNEMAGVSELIKWKHLVDCINEPNKIKTLPCFGKHKPYPEGICTQCSPSNINISLSRQSFRMVDHVEFDNAAIVDNFVGYWRATGYQRFAYLIGSYEAKVDELSPIGIKAVVNALYEPPQDNSIDGFEILDNNNDNDCTLTVNKIAASLGLEVVGCVYTDLSRNESEPGKVVYKRSLESYFVSGLETTFMAEQQLFHPTKYKAKLDSSAFPLEPFSSRFVTLIITGNEEGHIDLFPYQCSVLAEKLYEYKIAAATTDPNLMMMLTTSTEEASNNHQILPSLCWQEEDSASSVQLRKVANPTFPVDYLVVNLTHGFRAPGSHSTFSFSTFTFPCLFRDYDIPPGAVSLLQFPSLLMLKERFTPLFELMAQMQQREHQQDLILTNTKEIVLKSMQLFSDWNLLLYIESLNIVSSSVFHELLLKGTVKETNADALLSLLSQDSFQTLLTILSNSQKDLKSSEKKSELFEWTCKHCTFVNLSVSKAESLSIGCEMCGLPNE